MPRDAPVVQKYLQRHGQCGHRLATQLTGSWHRALVIPVFAERLEEVLSVAGAVNQPQDLLEIWVVNAPDTATGEELERNRRLVEELDERAMESPGGTEGLRRIQLEPSMRSGCRQILVLDFWSEGCRLPADQGVGLARKLGADLALALWFEGRLHESWLWMTDADARLPADYFERIGRSVEHCNEHGGGHFGKQYGLPFGEHFGEHSADLVGCLYPFRHRPEGDARQQDALRRYEVKLRQLGDGLRLAGSPYAFTAIGSLIACQAVAYAQVGGVPRRAAGEDFHFLNKLAKLGRIAQLEGEPVELSGRVSLRVPFGTGRVMAEALGGAETRLAPYPQRCFQSLAAFLAAAGEAVRMPGHGATRLAFCARRMELAGFDALRVQACLADLQVDIGLGFTQSGHAPEQRLKQFHDWFDGLKTLRWIHWGRDHG